MKKYSGRTRGCISIFVNILLIVFSVIFVFSLVKIILWYNENQTSNRVMKTISEDIKVVKDTNLYKIDFDNLRKINKDVVAFIKVNGTNIEYPIVKANDNEYYLNHSFDNSVNSAGWPFANYINEFDGTDKNITVFGHARRDGSMFGSLYKTLSNNWREDKNNLKILFITERDTFYYQVFSTYKVLSEDYYIKNNFNNDDEYRDFLNKIKSRSNYNYDVDLDVDDSILTLSTCASNDKYRIVLHAKRL